MDLKDYLYNDCKRIIEARNYMDKFKTHKDSMYFVYVLELQNGNIYVGASENIYRRLLEHFNGNLSAVWVKLHSPIVKILEICYDCQKDTELYKTLYYMNLYGYGKVRGASYCKIEYFKIPRALLEFRPTIRNDKHMTEEEIKEIEIKVKQLINDTSTKI